MSFGDFFSEADYDTLFSVKQFENIQNKRLAHSKIFRTYEYQWDSNHYPTDKDPHEMFGFIKSFLDDLNAKGLLGKIPNLDGHKFRYAHIWNNYVKTKQIPEDDFHSFRAMIYQIFSALIIDGYKEDCIKSFNPGTETRDYKRFVKIVDDCKQLDSMCVEWECKRDGKRYHLKTNSWQNFELATYDPTQNYAEVGLKTLPMPSIIEIEVEFKTGNLLISDWFRDNKNTLKQYCKIVEDAEYKDYSIPSINCEYGCIFKTFEYYLKLGIIFVSVKNTCPDVFLRGNEEIIVGYNSAEYGEYETEEEYDEAIKLSDDVVRVGNVCTDLWWVTIIEEEELEKIFKNTAIKNSFLKVKIPPGKYKLYFSGDHEEFSGLTKNSHLEEKENKLIPFFKIKKV